MLACLHGGSRGQSALCANLHLSARMSYGCTVCGFQLQQLGSVQHMVGRSSLSPLVFSSWLCIPVHACTSTCMVLTGQPALVASVVLPASFFGEGPWAGLCYAFPRSYSSRRGKHACMHTWGFTARAFLSTHPSMHGRFGCCPLPSRMGGAPLAFFSGACTLSHASPSFHTRCHSRPQGAAGRQASPPPGALGCWCASCIRTCAVHRSLMVP